MIYVCYSLHDADGAYSKFTGCSMRSVFAGARETVVAHLLHDETLTPANRRRFLRLAEDCGQTVLFHSVRDAAPEAVDRLLARITNEERERFSPACFYRLLAPLALPDDVRRCIYLDSDTVVDGAIDALWQTPLKGHPLAAVTETDVTGGALVDYEKPLIGMGRVRPEAYFGSGVLLLDLDALRQFSARLLDEGLDIVRRYECRYVDQDILNYFFSADCLHLDRRWNMYVDLVRLRPDLVPPRPRICHFVSRSLGCGMPGDPWDRLFCEHLAASPFCDGAMLMGLLAALGQEAGKSADSGRCLFGRDAHALYDRSFESAMRGLFPRLEGTLVEQTPGIVALQPLRQVLREKRNTLFLLFTRGYDQLRETLEAWGCRHGRDFLAGRAFLPAAASREITKRALWCRPLDENLSQP